MIVRAYTFGMLTPSPKRSKRNAPMWYFGRRPRTRSLTMSPTAGPNLETVAACAADDIAASSALELVDDVMPVRRVLVDPAPATHRRNTATTTDERKEFGM